MRTLVRTAGLALLALLVGASAASASTASLQNSVVTYDGDPDADSVELARVVSGGNTYYLVFDDET